MLRPQRLPGRSDVLGGFSHRSRHRTGNLPATSIPSTLITAATHRRGIAAGAVEQRAREHRQADGCCAPGDVEAACDVAELVLVPVLRDRAGGEPRDDAVADADEAAGLVSYRTFMALLLGKHRRPYAERRFFLTEALAQSVNRHCALDDAAVSGEAPGGRQGLPRQIGRPVVGRMNGFMAQKHGVTPAPDCGHGASIEFIAGAQVFDRQSGFHSSSP